MDADPTAEKSIMGAIIFDLDGTLIDSMPAHIRAFSLALKKTYSIPESEGRIEYLATSGQPLTDQFAYALSLYGHHPSEPDLQDLVRQFWTALYNERFELFPSTFDVLTQLLGAGYNLAVSSGSSPEAVASKLRYTRIDAFFSLVLGTDYDTHRLMKGPDHIQAVQNHFKLSDSQFKTSTLLVGDGLYDMQLARQFGLKAVGISRNGNEQELAAAGANLLIQDIRELLTLLATIEKRSFLPVSHIKFVH